VIGLCGDVAAAGAEAEAAALPTARSISRGGSGDGSRVHT
jgi:hypothetical protein